MQPNNRRIRVAMVVPNPCAPDFRVQKEAETLAMAGHEICVFCTARLGLPADEYRAGVRYRRIEWQPMPPLRALKDLFMPALSYRPPSPPVTETRTIEVGGSALHLQQSRLAQLIGPRCATMLRGWIRNRVQTLYQPYLEAGFARAFGPTMIDFRADVVHAHDLLALPVAAYVARETDAKLVFDSHELEAHRNPPLTRARRQQVERMEARLLGEAAAVLTVSDRIADHLASQYNITRPLVIYNSPRLADQRHDIHSKLPDLRSLAQAPPNALVLVYTGNIALNRGLETAISALGVLRRRGEDVLGGRPVCLVAMGRCSSALAAELSEQAAREGVSDRLFLLPPVPPEVVSGQIATADAALIPIVPLALSYEYAMPNKLFEAIFAGLPVLASDLAEMGSFLRHTGLGMTFRPADPSALAEAISTAFPGGRSALPSPDSEWIRTLSWEVQADKLIALYEQLGGQ